MKPQLYGQLIFGKAGKNIQWKKRQSFQQIVLGKLDSHMQKNESGSLSYNIHSKWMKDLNVRQESIKILEENTGSNFLLDPSPKTRETKAKMNYWDFIKIKRFCTAKETVKKTKRQLTEWEKIFANVLSNERLVSKIYKELNKTQHPKNK